MDDEQWEYEKMSDKQLVREIIKASQEGSPTLYFMTQQVESGQLSWSRGLMLAVLSMSEQLQLLGATNAYLQHSLALASNEIEIIPPEELH